MPFLTEAAISIDFRLVPDQNARAVRAMLEAHFHGARLTIVVHQASRPRHAAAPPADHSAVPAMVGYPAFAPHSTCRSPAR